MEVVVERCAGIDVHKDMVAVCVRVPGADGERVAELAEFSTFTGDLLALRDWLVAHGVSRVGMEATGVYWKPVFWVLEDAVECWLLNARHMRNVPGRKTDMADAEWICRLMEHGLVRASFVPPPAIRELRDLTRFRRPGIEERTREAQRLDKILQDAGVKLSSVASEVLGRSGRDMLEALVAGSRDPAVLAELAEDSCDANSRSSKLPWPAGSGLITPCWSARSCPCSTTSTSRSSGCRSRSTGCIAPFAEARDRLRHRPGDRPAHGRGHHRRDRRRHVAASRPPPTWPRGPGCAPASTNPPARPAHGTARHGNSWLQRHLTVAAMSASRPKNTYLAAQYRRIAGRRGKLRARKAVGHSLLVGVLAHPGQRVAPGTISEPDYYDRRQDPATPAPTKTRRARAVVAIFLPRRRAMAW